MTDEQQLADDREAERASEVTTVPAEDVLSDQRESLAPWPSDDRAPVVSDQGDGATQEPADGLGEETE